MIRAAKEGHADCVAALAPVSDARATDHTGATALMWAIHSGDIDSFQRLLPLSDARATTLAGETALMIAANHGRSECLRALLPLSDVHATTPDGDTALMAAAQGGSIECLRALTPLCDVNAQNDEGVSAMMQAAAQGNDESVRTLLRRADLNVAAVDRRGQTALDAAIEARAIQCVDLIAADSRTPVEARTEAIRTFTNKKGECPLKHSRIVEENRVLREALGCVGPRAETAVTTARPQSKEAIRVAPAASPVKELPAAPAASPLPAAAQQTRTIRRRL